MTFEYIPDTEGLVESFWEFEIGSQQISMQFLLVHLAQLSSDLVWVSSNLCDFSVSFFLFLVSLIRS